jgi:orotidine-5'-phosphate decarboxylase
MQTPSNWALLLENVDGSNLCLGIDPHKDILEKVWGLNSTSENLNMFWKRVLKVALEVKKLHSDNIKFGKVAAIKPQSAFFENFGHLGIKELEELLFQANSAKVPTILDIKRGDIGSTMDAYCEAYLNPESPLCADSITVSPFLGTTELAHVAKYAQNTNRGIFVLCRTSNTGASEIQNSRIKDNYTVAHRIFDFASEFNKGSDLPTVGLVVGATIGENDLDFANFNGPVLAPGIGAQGATIDDLSTVFASGIKNVLPSASRSILNAGPNLDDMVNAVCNTFVVDCTTIARSCND